MEKLIITCLTWTKSEPTITLGIESNLFDLGIWLNLSYFVDPFLKPKPELMPVAAL